MFLTTRNNCGMAGPIQPSQITVYTQYSCFGLLEIIRDIWTHSAESDYCIYLIYMFWPTRNNCVMSGPILLSQNTVYIQFTCFGLLEIIQDVWAHYAEPDYCIYPIYMFWSTRNNL